MNPSSMWDNKFLQNPVMYSDISRLWKYIEGLILKPYENKIVLDIGCGVGGNSLFFLEKGFNVEAFDFSAVALGHSMKINNAFLSSGKLKLSQNSFLDFKFSKKYDLILAIAVLQFFKTQIDVENYIKKLQENTVKKGVHILSFPIDNKENRKEYDLLINHGSIKRLYSNGAWEIFDKLTCVTIGSDPEGNNSREIFILVARKRF